MTCPGRAAGSELELVERRAEPRPGGARGSSSGSPAGDAEALSSTLAGVHLEDAGADVLGALAAKYSCDYSAGPPGDAAPQESPLHWYGQLVPPALKEAEADFKSGAPVARARCCDGVCVKTAPPVLGHQRTGAPPCLQPWASSSDSPTRNESCARV